MKRLVYKKPDGRITILIPSPKFENNIQHVRERNEAINPNTPASDYVCECDHTELPQSREFRGQWRIKDGKVEVDPVLETEERWKRIRIERNKRLDESDKSMLRIQETEPAKSGVWKTYRQELRDVTEQSDPKNIVWPVEP